MRLANTVLLGLAQLTVLVAADYGCPLIYPAGETVSSDSLQNALNMDSMLEMTQTWQDFAYEEPCNCRRTGLASHNNTLEYIYNRLVCTDYYNVERQLFNTSISVFSEANLTVDGVEYPQAGSMANSKNATLEGVELIWTNSYGCNGSSDWPTEAVGRIGLISRGPADPNVNCTFNLKSVNARTAGLAGLIVYDHTQSDEPLMGLLEPGADTVPTLGIGNINGLYLVESLRNKKVTVDYFHTAELIEQRYSYNVIASSRSGDPNNVIMVGAHTDSVQAGPGINDNGSGSATLLETALRLASFQVNNQVRFGWWAAEEEDLVGSTFYVSELPAEAAMQIRLYLNFDMVASGNGIYTVYDGDGSAFNSTGPPGSADAEALFTSYFAGRTVPLTETQFDGRSDYNSFITLANIPAGGLFTGAEELKTAEQAMIWGGTPDQPLDVNYHGRWDTVGNMSTTMWDVNARAMAHAVATYAYSWEGFPPREPPKEGGEAMRMKSKRSSSVRDGKRAAEYKPPLAGGVMRMKRDRTEE